VVKQPPKILSLKSDISELQKIENLLKEIFKSNHIPEKYFNKVLLCVSEAAQNSIKHGNKNDANKQVSVELDCVNHEIIVQIEDEGEGFNINEVKDPTKEENLKSESGRGIHIIKTLSENIEYNKRGNRIKFKIDCSEQD
jgi:serine/threonine-protein kinase RsbW